MWFDRLTTNGVKIPTMLKHDKVKVRSVKDNFSGKKPGFSEKPGFSDFMSFL